MSTTAGPISETKNHQRNESHRKPSVGRFRYLLAFYHQNGLYVTVGATLSRLVTSVRSLIIAHGWSQPPTRLSIGAHPYLRGLQFISVGDNFRAGKYLRLEAIAEHNGHLYSPRIVIKDDVSVSDFVHLAATTYLEIGKGVLVGSKVFITDHGHGAYAGTSQSDPASGPQTRPVSSGAAVVVGDNVWIGEAVVILPGVTIGQGAIVGANAVVTRSIASFTMVAGNPARPIKRFDPNAGIWSPIKEHDQHSRPDPR